ncbi:MAG: GAF domain-containing sensor histidine kinase [Candidatus Flexifilum sp.]
MTQSVTRQPTMTTSAVLEWQLRLARALYQQRLSTPDILQTALSLTCEALRAPDGCIVMFDDDGGLRHAFLFGSEANAESARELWNNLINYGFIGSVQHSHRYHVIHAIADDPHWPRSASPTARLVNGSAVGVPILYEQVMYGVVALIHPSTDYFDPMAVGLIAALGEITGMALANAALLEAARTREAGFRRLAERAQNERAERVQMDQLRRDLTAMTYHDLRGPLQNIQTSLTMLERLIDRGDADRAARIIPVAVNSVHQVARMVKSLLDIERLEQGKPILNRAQIDIRQLVAAAVDGLLLLASEADQQLTMELADDLPAMAIDGDMIQRVIMNLIENAIKHTPAGGAVAVRAQLADYGDGPSLLISVADTGPGIPAEYRDEIFDKYFRIKRTNAPQGVGLGLAFCRLAVEAHGGRIWVESEPDQGSVFAFTLPLHLNS